MRTPMRLALASVLLVQAGWAQAPSQQTEDPILQSLIRDALEKNPELAGARERVSAEKERIPQAGSLPDPILSLGYQNDGFKRLEIGRMETTWATIMATQALPYLGKRKLREEVVQQGVNAARAGLERTRLSLEAEVRRSYTSLLLVRERLGLLKEQEALWEKAEAVARIRYETGQGIQMDLLRTQLERTRLKLVRTGLAAEERNAVTALNRLASRPLKASIDTSARLEELPVPELPADPRADAEARSPELAEAQHHLKHSQSQVDLARLERRPDFALSAGVMPRGALPAMWQVGFSVSLPIYAGTKQKRAVAENEALARSGQQIVANLHQLLAQRTQERVDQLAAANETLRIYREGLLTQSEATVQSALAQYQVGRTTFASVLEALNGYLADRGRYLEGLAQVQALGIAFKEVTLGPTPGLGVGALMNSASMGGAAASPTPSRRTSAPSSKSESASAMSGM